MYCNFCAVRQNGLALRYAHELLRQDKEIALEAIAQTSIAIYYVHEELKKDKDVVFAILLRIIL